MADFEASGCRGDLVYQTLADLVDHAAQAHGDAVFIEADSVRIRFADLPELVDRAATALMALGVAQGDRVALWAPNHPNWVLVALGIQRVGACLVPINTRYRGDEAAYILERSGARLLVTIEGFLDTDYLDLLARAESQPQLDHVVLLDGLDERAVSWQRFVALGAEVAPAELAARRRQVRAHDLCDLLFTSGTTGAPKGVPSTHAQTLRVFRDWAEVVGLRAGDRYLVAMPFFHSFGYKAGWLACLMTGATVLPEPVFDPERLLRRVGRDRVSVLPGPPALYQTILARQDLDAYDRSSLRLAVTGAAVIPVTLIEQMRHRLGFETVITGYGLTETTGVVTMCRHDDDPETIATTSGRSIPDVEVKIIRSDGLQANAGEAGEVLVRGYNVMSGYWRDDVATAEAIESDGFLHTGDIGMLDARGYLQITDRKKDMVIVGGFNVYPAEVEQVLLAHPAVAQAAVVGVPDQRLGEVCVAYLVAKQGAVAEEEGLMSLCRERLANFKVPRAVRWVDSLPMNASGKVLKYKLKERAHDATTS